MHESAPHLRKVSRYPTTPTSGGQNTQASSRHLRVSIYWEVTYCSLTLGFTARDSLRGVYPPLRPLFLHTVGSDPRSDRVFRFSYRSRSCLSSPSFLVVSYLYVDSVRDCSSTTRIFQPDPTFTVISLGL